MKGRSTVILHSIIHFGVMISFMRIKMGILCNDCFLFVELMEINMPINNMYFKWWDWKFLLMLGRVIIAVYLHMGKQVLANPIQWLDMEQIKYIDIKKGYCSDIMLIDISANREK
jgi:hypothetical protein